MINKVKSFLIDKIQFILFYLVAVSTFSVIVYLLTSEIFNPILLFLIVDVLLGHYFESKIEHNKLLYTNSPNVDSHLFNSDYYDLYWNYNLMMIRMSFGLFSTLVYLVNSLFDLKLMNLLMIASFLLVLAVALVGIVCSEFGHYKKIRKLIDKRKQEYYFKFDSYDLKIINKNE